MENDDGGNERNRMKISEISTKYAVRKMQQEDIDIIYELSVGNPMFFRYCPPYVTRESIISDMEALPPHCTKEQKYYIGFFAEEKLIAIMDLIDGYPRADIAYIGLFMVNKDAQGKGVGSEIIHESLEYLKHRNFSAVQLAYAKGNPQSEAFWKKNGFVPTGKETDHGEYYTISMEKKL